jgi:hypothetical protein
MTALMYCTKNLVRSGVYLTLTPQYLIDVPVPRHESEGSCMCVFRKMVLNQRLRFSYWILELV